MKGKVAQSSRVSKSRWWWAMMGKGEEMDTLHKKYIKGKSHSWINFFFLLLLLCHINICSLRWCVGGGGSLVCGVIEFNIPFFCLWVFVELAVY